MKFFSNFANILKRNKSVLYNTCLCVFVPTAFIYVNDYNDNIYLRYLSLTKSSQTSLIIKNNKYNWKTISQDKSLEAIQLCKDNLDKVYWYEFCKNESPEAIAICSDNLDRLCWYTHSLWDLLRKA